MNDVTKLAFFDELEKIGYLDEELAAHLLKEAGLLGSVGTAAKGLIKGAPKAMPKVSPERMAQMQAAWKAGAGRAGQATRKVMPTQVAMPGGGSVGRMSFAPAMA